MFRLLFCTLLCSSMAYAQLAACTDAEHCPSGQFCEGHFCKECLDCGDMRREPPRYHTECIKSVVECGACVHGYTQDRSGATSDCAPADGPGVSPYVWLGLAIGLATIVIVFAILVFFYLHRNTENVKISASTSAQISAPVATAPQPPPPYNLAVYDPPYPPTHTYIEEASPLVKRPGSLRGDARESARRQAARVYNNPAYVRGAPLPGSPELSYEDESSRAEPFVSHDEDTMESVWTPATDSAARDDSGNASVLASDAAAVSLPAVRRGGEAELAPPNKMLCLPQDTNNNRNSDSGSSDENPSSTSGGTSVTLNFNLNVNTNAVQQLNNVSL